MAKMAKIGQKSAKNRLNPPCKIGPFRGFKTVEAPDRDFSKSTILRGIKELEKKSQRWAESAQLKASKYDIFKKKTLYFFFLKK